MSFWSDEDITNEDILKLDIDEMKATAFLTIVGCVVCPLIGMGMALAAGQAAMAILGFLILPMGLEMSVTARKLLWASITISTMILGVMSGTIVAAALIGCVPCVAAWRLNRIMKVARRRTIKRTS